ncbi:MAG: hypothetical protein WKF90_00040 [Pyrinomonadaceae bacterium]
MAKNTLTKVDDTKKDFASIVAATNKKNPAQQDIEALREMMREDASIWQNHGDWAKQTELVILNEYFETSGFLLETVKKKLANLRDELGWENATVLEKLLIRQVCLTWLRLYYLERQHQQATSGSHSLVSGTYWDKRLSMAQKRHLKAIESLAKVRKMITQTAKLEAAASKAKSSHNLNSIKILEAMTKSDG